MGGQPRLGCLEMPASDVLPFSFGRSFSYRWGSSPCDTMATVSGACCLGCVEMSLSYRRGTGLCDALALVFGACRPGCLEMQLWYRRGSSPPDTMALFRCLQPWLSGDVVVASSLGDAGPSPNEKGLLTVYAPGVPSESSLEVSRPDSTSSLSAFVADWEAPCLGSRTGSRRWHFFENSIAWARQPACPGTPGPDRGAPSGIMPARDHRPTAKASFVVHGA